MPKEESLLLIRLGVHGDQATAGSKEDDVFAGYFGPLEVCASLWGVAYDVLKLHDWVTVQFGVNLSRLTDVHSSLIGPIGNIAVAVSARHTDITHALAFEPLCAQSSSLVCEAKDLVG